MRFIDTHCHLSLLEHDTTDNILARAADAKLEKMVTVSTDTTNWDANRDFAAKHEHVYYSLGLHPHEAKFWKDCKDNLLNRFKDGTPSKCVAIGELGLDYHYNHSTEAEQLAAFEAQLELALNVDLPIIIHCRDAFNPLFNIIKKRGLPTQGGVMHCFTGGPPEAADALALGLKISFSGVVTFKSADKLRQAAKQVPLESMLIETDCPFLAPVPLRGRPNEPSFLPHTAQCLADVLGLELEQVAEQTTLNATAFFNL